MLIQGPGQQGLSQTVVCKQAGASLIIVTGTSKDAARMEVAKALGADYVIDVQEEDPLARIMEITGGKGVDVVLDCTAGAGTLPRFLARKAWTRSGASAFMAPLHRGPGRDGGISEFSDRPDHRESYHHQKRARAQLQGMRAGFAAAGIEAFPAGEAHDAQVWTQRCGPCHQVGRRPGRAGRFIHASLLPWK